MQGEFRGDFTRDSSNRNKHFLRVLMQQGRVQLDADWNEQVGTLLYYLQTLAADLIGPYGGPALNVGFEIKAADSNNFIISNGHYYVDGILCELESISAPISKLENKNVTLPKWAFQYPEFQKKQYVEVFSEEGRAPNPIIVKIAETSLSESTLELTLSPINPSENLEVFKPRTKPKIRSLTTFKTQIYYRPEENVTLPRNKYLVYLDVWERHITHIEDASDLIPGIQETALRGADTTTRSQVVHQVRVLPNLDIDNNRIDKIKTDSDEFRSLLGELIKPGQGRLMARAQQPASGMDNPCLISPESKYRGAENQLYRVEIFEKKDGGTFFVWSRENSSVIFPILHISVSSAQPTRSTNGTPTIRVTLEHFGNDDRFSLSEGDWVEIVDDDYTLQDSYRNIFQVEKIDLQESQVSLSGTTEEGFIAQNHPYLRRWDSQGLIPINPIPINQSKSEGWILLEQGVEVKFEEPNLCHVGDYWLIPARAAIGDVEWLGTKDNPIALLPHGVYHHYAPIAVITVDDDGKITEPVDCRHIFKRMAGVS